MKRIRYGTGAIRHSNLYHKIARALRPKFHKSHLAGGGIDWVKGYDCGQMVIKDQGNSFSCGGQAGAYWRENQIRLLNNEYIPLSAKSIYSLVAYPQGGTTGSSLSAQLCLFGVNTEKDVPSYQPDGTPMTELQYTDKSWLTPILKLDAATRANLVKVSVKHTTDDIAQAVFSSGGVIWQIDGEDGHAWLGTDPTIPNNNGQEDWSHFMFSGGFLTRNNRQTIKSTNSWGQNIGDKGQQYFNDDYIKSPYLVDCFTFLPRSAFTATGTPLQWLLVMFQNMLHI